MRGRVAFLSFLSIDLFLCEKVFLEKYFAWRSSSALDSILVVYRD